MKNIIISFGMVLLFTTILFAGQKHNYRPAAGYVPDAETAIKIAVAVWVPIYGKDQIEKQAPFHTELIEGVWHVKGSLPEPKEQKDKNGNTIKSVTAGGVAEAEISKTTGEILRVSHGE